MPKGGPAGSGVFGATISAAPERLGGAGLGNIFGKVLKKGGAGPDLDRDENGMPKGGLEPPYPCGH